MDDNAAAFGSFKLSLQSVVCHRGVSVYSGHYVSLVRGSWPDGEDKWMLFDDLASPRIKPIEIDRALKEESPYLLFYQIQPIEGDPTNISRGERPPSYLSEAKDSGLGDMSQAGLDSDAGTTGISTGRPSFEESDTGARRGRTSTSRERRLSIAFTNASTASLAQTDDTNGSVSVTRKDSRRSRRSENSRTQSRAASQSGGDGRRLSQTFQRFAGKIPPLSSMTGTKPSETTIVDEPRRAPQEKSAYAENNSKISASGLDPVMAERGKGKLKKDVRDKSRDKSREKSSSGKKIRKEDRPDRECSMM